jgi:putative tryptophan/tyrosine transport system substrate-binding protein
VKRREFITLLGGTAVAWPLAARAQQSGPMQRIGVLIAGAEDDEEEQLRIAAFQQGLAKLGWTDGHNMRIDYRWAGGDIDRIRALAAELVDLRPDVLFAPGSTPTLAALRQATRAIPIVFAAVADPIGSGFVASLARPGGNITGLINFEPPLASKWVELLKGMAPGLRQAAFLFNPEFAPFAGESFRYAEAAAARLKVELTAAAVHDDRDIEDALAALARLPNGGLVVNPDIFNRFHRQQIVALSARHSLPAVYPFRYYATEGGLISYGPDVTDLFQQAASYVDRILRGEKPANLPVQAPARFEMVINLRTARTIGLEVPQQMLALADAVIE